MTVKTESPAYQQSLLVVEKLLAPLVRLMEPCFLIREGLGLSGDRELALRWLDTLESMYHRDGWYMDGSPASPK